MSESAEQTARNVENILLITVDSLRYDLTLTSSPQLSAIERLSEDGVSFEHAYATGPGTTPSFPAMLTGTLPLSYGGLGPLTDERPRVASNLRDAGLTTGGFQSNPFLSRHFNYNVGFDTFEDYQNPLMGIATKIFPRGIELSNPQMKKIDEVFHLTDIIKKTYELVKGKPRPYVNAETITTDAINWLDDADDSFFGWVHYMDVHHPCYPPEQYRAQFDVADISQTDVSEWYSQLLTQPETLSKDEIDSLRRLYDAAVLYTDDQINRLLDKLSEMNRYEDTLIVYTSDHGELFGEHGAYGKPRRMYDELLHIPLIITNGPEGLSEYSSELVSLLDLPPLFHNVLGVESPHKYEGQGITDTKREFIIAEHEMDGEVIVAARSKDLLFEVDKIRNEDRLSSIKNGEFVENYQKDAPDSEDIQQAVLNRLSNLDVNTRRLEDEVEGDVQDRLEDLGYL
ncbi:sulfatase [Haloferax sp. Q22]|uniref:sulfatase n=1 Tax=Haloferax sp. (strain Q22) TaxID=1526048 RepID=UPI0009E97DC5|nr:sulfatase [Haloferax sp. Q22]